MFGHSLCIAELFKTINSTIQKCIIYIFRIKEGQNKFFKIRGLHLLRYFIKYKFSGLIGTGLLGVTTHAIR